MPGASNSTMRSPTGQRTLGHATGLVHAGVTAGPRNSNRPPRVSTEGELPHRCAVSHRDTEGAPAIKTFDTVTWRPQATYCGPAGEYFKVQFSGDDGQYLVATVDALRVVNWLPGMPRPAR
jgi:hypothetical protein